MAFRLRPLLTANEFATYCQKRNLNIDRERLLRLEAHRLFMPLARVSRPLRGTGSIVLNNQTTGASSWRDFVVETYGSNADYPIPRTEDPGNVALYSVFQIWDLEEVLDSLSYSIELDSIAEGKGIVDSVSITLGTAREHIRLAASWRSELRRTVAALAQFVSNAYMPKALSNKRTVSITRSNSYGGALSFDSRDWDWHDFREAWDPHSAMTHFQLDRSTLEGIHRLLQMSIQDCDPLYEWSNLVQFISNRKKNLLRGDALRAELYRQMAQLMKCLYEELYEGQVESVDRALGIKNDTVPEIAVQKDPRRHLEFVVNQYEINPQAKVVLIVEGDSEERFVEDLCPRLLGYVLGTAGIEIVNVRGVGNATGNKKHDRYSAILRLVDYLHDHQVVVFVVLDREGAAAKLQQAAKTRKPLAGLRRRVIPPERVTVWRRNFEFDNFSDTDLATALTEASGGRHRFAREDVARAREASDISRVYRLRTGSGLDKRDFARILANLVVSPKTRKRPENRPMVRILLLATEAGLANRLPVTEKVRRENQRALDRPYLRIPRG